jgi:hypothetical protein
MGRGGATCRWPLRLCGSRRGGVGGGAQLPEGTSNEATTRRAGGDGGGGCAGRGRGVGGTPTNAKNALPSVRLDPFTVALTFRSNPGGLKVNIVSADSSLSTPVTHTYVVNSQIHLIAPVTATKGGQTYAFQSWSDGGRADHTITAPGTATTYMATYRKR